MRLRTAVLLALLPVALQAAGAVAEPVRPTAETVLRRAELTRSPSLGISVDLELSVVAHPSGRQLREARFVLLTHRSGRSLLLLETDPALRLETGPAALLLTGDAYWLWLPGAQAPVELPLRHVVAGDLSQAGVLGVDLRRRFQPRHDGIETVEETPCWRLELAPRPGAGTGDLPFGRVRYWAAQEDGRPIRIDYHGHDGRLLKSVRFTRYRDTGLGRRPARIEITDAHRPAERAVLVLGVPQGVPTSALDFDLEDLEVLRQVARRLTSDGAQRPSGPILVRHLLVADRQRAVTE